MYIKINKNNEIEYPYSIRQLRRDNKNISIPRTITTDILNSFNVFKVITTDKPYCTELQEVVENGVEKDSNGNFTTSWKIVPMFSDYTNEEGVVVTKAEQESEYLAKKLIEAKQQKINQIKQNSLATDPVEILVDLLDGTQHSIIFNGGDTSASAISGAIQLAQNLGETSVKLWDIENVLHEVSLTEALDISAFIAKEYRDKMYLRQEAIMAVNNCTTTEEIEAL